jgi:hypothetical protein
MKIINTIQIPTYSCDVTFIVTDLFDKVAKDIYKKYKITEEYEDGNEGIIISPNLHKYFLIIDLKYLTHNTIAHEVYHVATRVTEERGVTDEEAQAWLCGHLSGVIYKFLEKKKLEIKHG